MDFNEKSDDIGQQKHQEHSNGVSHHDTHAIPPQFVQDAYVHYKQIKHADLDKDSNVIDFSRGLTAEQKKVLVVVNTIKISTVEAACRIFAGHDGEDEPDRIASIKNDIPVYEHLDFPGLQITPGILSPAAQIKFVSRILHDHFADSNHKTNLQIDYDIEYPPTPSQETGTHSPKSSLFKYLPTKTHSNPKNPSTTPSLNMVQLLSKKFRWLTIGTQYDWPTRSYQRNNPTTFPSDIADLVTSLFPHIKPESGVCLLYGSKDYMPVHRDVSEQCQTALASFSFGCDGIFLVARDATEGDEEERKRTVAIRVRSGDCVHMTGESRWAWHAMPRTIPGTCPEGLDQWPVGSFSDATKEEVKVFEKWKGFMKGKRLNVSCRQVWDEEEVEGA